MFTGKFHLLKLLMNLLSMRWTHYAMQRDSSLFIAVFVLFLRITTVMMDGNYQN